MHSSHQKWGKHLDLYHFEEHSPGMPYWHPAGMRVLSQLQNMWQEKMRMAGFLEVQSPILNSIQLWEQSGHWEKFQHAMYHLEVDGQAHGLKPMNCPCHIQIYQNARRSYREMPVRYAEWGHVHRYEPSGSLGGLLRVRSFHQDDGHIFCRPAQVVSEVVRCLKLAKDLYEEFDLVVHAELSGKPESAYGSDALWQQAEGELARALDAIGLRYVHKPGEGAFYGPKIDLHARDSQNRSWQLGSVQLDYVLPERFNLQYVNENDERERPVMIHRAAYGSVERFLGIILEHYQGHLPIKIAPSPVAIVPISEAQSEYANEIAWDLRKQGLHVEVLDSGSVGNRIRVSHDMHIPMLFVIGAREMQDGHVSVQMGKDKQIMNRVDAVNYLVSLRSVS